jgi:hypothetical protein
MNDQIRRYRIAFTLMAAGQTVSIGAGLIAWWTS